MQFVSSRIWTRVAVSISYDDNHYTMSTSINLCIVMILAKEQSYHYEENEFLI